MVRRNDLSLVGDRDRQQAVALLREHFVQGRLTLDELSVRAGSALRARTQRELRRVLAGLPRPAAPTFVRGLARGAALMLLTGAWLLFSFVLLMLFGIVLLIHAASVVEFAGFLVVWLLPTYLLSRQWRRGLTRHIRGA